MRYIIDKTTGTGATPFRAPYAGDDKERYAIVTVAFVKNNPTTENVAAVENTISSMLGKFGLEPTTCSSKYNLVATNKPNPFIEYDLHVGFEAEDVVEDEPQQEDVSAE